MAKVHTPRETTAITLFMEPEGNGEHACASPTPPASNSLPVTGEGGRGPSPNCDRNAPRPATFRALEKLCPLVVAPTLITPGVSPGVLMEARVGCAALPVAPSLPAEATTIIPARIAFSTAAAKMSQALPVATPQVAPVSEGPDSAGAPRASTATSMPSLSASSSA